MAQKIVYPDIGNFYAENEVYDSPGDWKVYSDKHAYVGYVYIGTGGGRGVVYPEDMTSKHTEWISKDIDEVGNTLKNAVRFLYLNWERIKLQHKIRKTLQEVWGNDVPGPDAFSPQALGSQYMPENTNETSKWPTSVDYPSLGVIAMRKSEDASMWKFVSSDYKFIGTYRVNPEQLSKNLKRVAEKAFAKWMGFDDSNINK